MSHAKCRLPYYIIFRCKDPYGPDFIHDHDEHFVRFKSLDHLYRFYKRKVKETIQDSRFYYAIELYENGVCIGGHYFE